MEIAELGPELGLHHFPDNFDFTGVKTFVDVGGADGSVSIAVARRVPSITCTVQDDQDLPSLVATAKAPQDVESRVHVMAHDIHTPQPVKDADIYVFRWVFHSWSDMYAVNILHNLIPALKPGARIIAIEFLLPEPGTLTPYRERVLRYVSVTSLPVHLVWIT